MQLCVVFFPHRASSAQRPKPSVNPAGVAHPQPFVQGEVRPTEVEDAEATAVECLGEGAGAEEEGESTFINGLRGGGVEMCYTLLNCCSKSLRSRRTFLLCTGCLLKSVQTLAVKPNVHKHRTVEAQ